MLRITELKLPINHAETDLAAALVARLEIKPDALLNFIVFRRGYDSRKKADVQLVYTLDVEVVPAHEAYLLKKFRKDVHIGVTPDTSYKLVATPVAFAENSLRPVVIGLGPCGMLAALILAQMGLKPIILERGKIVRERTKDTWAFWRKGELDPESNVQFGEGGAGTFSDGKLWSQVKDPKHYGRKVLEEFVKAGAPDEILYSSKPHVGTFRLVKMVEHIRGTIESLGGEFRFQHKVVDIELEAGATSNDRKQIRGVVLENGETLRADNVILAIGHSARDTFQMLFDRGVYIEAKPFSIGFRIEHPQPFIDRTQYHLDPGQERPRLLPAARYRLATKIRGRGVHSFCMCPGGWVVPASTENDEVVVNGMSLSRRDSPFANSGMVATVEPEDLTSLVKQHGVLAGLVFQKQLEQTAKQAGGGGQVAPGQRVTDYLDGRISADLPETSYFPGLTSAPLHELLPPWITGRMREGLRLFGRQMHGYISSEALLIGFETRTSSPVRVPRQDDTLEHQQIAGLFPCGEGAGYAGGIVSAALDGLRIADAACKP